MLAKRAPDISGPEMDKSTNEIGTDESTPDPDMTQDSMPEEALYKLPPPPKYDVHVGGLSISPPAWKAGIPSPAGRIPIPNAFGRAIGQTPPTATETRRTLVRNVQVTVKSGQILAIMGGSGSGKTTCLNAIAGRLGNLQVRSGGVALAPSDMNLSSSNMHEMMTGEYRDRGSYPKEIVFSTFGPLEMGKTKSNWSQTLGMDVATSKLIGYVQQRDRLLEHLTVRETLHYAAALRLPKTVSSETRNAIVQETIRELGLKDCADTIVGGQFRKGISGGERRRTSIGSILVTLPSILVLDEPTSGLDSVTSNHLMETLRGLARRNRTIVLSVHQPSASMFASFDQILLMSRGNAVYSGGGNHILDWFNSQGCIMKNVRVNPADWLIDTTSVDLRDEDAEKRTTDQVNKLIDAWQAEKMRRIDSGCTLASITPSERPSELIRVTTSRSHIYDDDLRKRVHKPGIFLQTYILTRRGFTNVRRDYFQVIAYLCQAIGIGLLNGLVYYKLQETPAGIQSTKALTFFVTIYFYLTLVWWLFRFTTVILPVFDREREDGMVGVPAHVISTFLCNLPLNVTGPILYGVVNYFLSGLREDPVAIIVWIATLILMQQCLIAYANLCSSMQRNFASASLIANATVVFYLIPAGFLLTDIPVFVDWIKYISFYHYSFRVLVITQFRDRVFACTGIIGPALNQCKGNNVLLGLGISPSQGIAVYYGALAAWIFVVNMLAAIILQVYHPGGILFAPSAPAYRQIADDPIQEDREVGLPSRPRIDVTVKGLKLHYLKRGLSGKLSEKVILESVDAAFPAGQVSVVMGASGAGKSSLLHLLASRSFKATPLAKFDVAGEIMFNGVVTTPRQRKGYTAFVEQEDDHHLPALTVRETLQFAALLRLPCRIPKARKLERAEEVIRQLGLKDCADSLVGGELLKGISGGEKRRLSLAVQMLNDPSVLIVDEPTSGLDAFIAHNIAKLLQDIARTGRTVIVSIHQPRSDIWNLFDNVVLLARGGRTAYAGTRVASLAYFSDFGHPCPELMNPAEFLLELLSVDLRQDAVEIKTKARQSRLLENWRDRSENEKFNTSIIPAGTSELEPFDYEMNPMNLALPVVLKRMFLNTWRQQDTAWARLVQAPSLAVVLWIFYLRLRYGSSGAQDRIGFIQEINATIFVGMLNSLAIYASERDLFYHEYHSKAYGVGTFMIAFLIFELPLEILSSIIFTLMMGVGANLVMSYRIFFQLLFTTWVLQNVGESVGIIFQTVTNDRGLSVSLVSTFLTFGTALNGIISIDVPYWLTVIAWHSPSRPAVLAIFTNEFNSGITFSCNADDISSGRCIAVDGLQVLETFHLKTGAAGDAQVLRYMGILAGLVVIWRLIAIAGIRFKLSLSS